MIYVIESNLIISTSRKPSQKTRRFAQFLKHYFNATYINRGKMSFSKVINTSKQEENSLLIVLMEVKGNPSNIDVYNLDKDEENPIFSLNFNVSLPKSNNRINTDSSKISIINKNNQLNSLFELFTRINTKEHVKENAIMIKESQNYMADVYFIDRDANTLPYKMYIKDFKIGD